MIFLLSNTGYKRTTKGFDSKNYVDSRTYMYICPTYAFAPIESVSIRMFRHLLEVLRCTTNVFFATYRTIQAPSEQFWSYTGLYLKKYAQVRALHMWGSQSIIKKKIHTNLLCGNTFWNVTALLQLTKRTYTPTLLIRIYYTSKV